MNQPQIYLLITEAQHPVGHLKTSKYFPPKNGAYVPGLTISSLQLEKKKKEREREIFIYLFIYLFLHNLILNVLSTLFSYLM